MPIFLFIFILVRDFNREVYIQSDYNNTLTMISILVYYIIFNKDKESFIKAFKFTICIHIFIATVQLLLYFNEMKEYSMIFHNHPSQRDANGNILYYFDSRVSGLHIESSQFASFLLFGIMFTFWRFQSHYSMLFIASLILVLLNQSITAYLILLVFLLLKEA